MANTTYHSDCVVGYAKQRSIYRYSNMPLTGVLTFYCSVLQLLLDFPNHILRKARKIFSFVSQTRVTSNKNKEVLLLKQRGCW